MVREFWPGKYFGKLLITTEVSVCTFKTTFQAIFRKEFREKRLYVRIRRKYAKNVLSSQQYQWPTVGLVAATMSIKCHYMDWYWSIHTLHTLQALHTYYKIICIFNLYSTIKSLVFDPFIRITLWWYRSKNSPSKSKVK